MRERHEISDVLNRGMCVGCGACELVSPALLRVELDDFGKWSATMRGDDEAMLANASSVCPFSDDSSNETAIASRVWPDLPVDDRIGRWRDIWAGRIRDEELIAGSSSGGLTTYVLTELLDREVVDGVIHVGKSSDGHFEYKVSTSDDEVLLSRKSNYTSVTLASVIRQIKGDGRKYALVGLPCFIRAARLLADGDDELRNQLVLFVGLVCGHLKTRFFAESLGWQAGVEPDDIGAVDFRIKEKGRPSNRYRYSVTSRSTGAVFTRRMSEVVDGSWGHGAFQPEACNFCDDIFAETADVVFADAWLPQYTSDWHGTNVVLSRSAIVSDILRDGVKRDEVELDVLTVDEAVESQAGNFRHRRDGLRVRLFDDLAEGLSVPQKRVMPSLDHVHPRRIRLIRARRQLSAKSLSLFLDAKLKGDLDVYLSPMREQIAGYKEIEVSRVRRAVRYIARIVDPVAPDWLIRVTARWRVRG